MQVRSSHTRRCLIFFISLIGKGTQCANLVKDFGFCHLSGAYSSPDALSHILTYRPQRETSSAPNSNGKAPSTAR